MTTITISNTLSKGLDISTLIEKVYSQLMIKLIISLYGLSHFSIIYSINVSCSIKFHLYNSMTSLDCEIFKAKKNSKDWYANAIQTALHIVGDQPISRIIDKKWFNGHMRWRQWLDWVLVLSCSSLINSTSVRLIFYD